MICKKAVVVFVALVFGFSGLALASTDDRNEVETGKVILNVNVKVWLEGAYNTTSNMMSSTLTDGSIAPTGQPFSGSEYDGTVLEYDAGTESVGASWPTGQGTDWVLVELRTGTDPSTRVAQKAAVVGIDGVVVEASDLSSQVAFSGVPAGDYYIVVRHRNHLPVMTAGVVTLSTGAMTQYDFSSASTQAFGTNPMKLLEAGVYGMYAANGNIDSFVTALDFNVYLPDEKAAQTGYRFADYNLDGFVTALDFNEYLPNEKLAAATSID